LDGLWNGADWSNAMCGEAGELANVVKKLRRLECASHTNLVGGADRDDLMEKLADEMGDVVAYLDLLATFYGIDLAEAVKDKFNRVSERQGFPERLP
jgi:NTP pyrophosphatase (non-canonical NTP hydrolase)